MRHKLFTSLFEAMNKPAVLAEDTGSGIPSAVLVLLINHPEEITVLLTKRADNLLNHQGQVCFPGGRVEKSDRGPVDTALRETFEEIGLAPKTVKFVGCLENYETLTGFSVTPVVGIVQPPIELKTSPREVAAVFEMPLSFLLDSSNHWVQVREQSSSRKKIYALSYQGYYIWGATAAILMNLYQLLIATSL